jgi:hypothetical protein
MRGPFGGTPFFLLVTTVLLSALSILARSQKPGTSGGGPSITTQMNQRFEELKQDKARIEQAAQSPNISREQREQAKQAAATIEKVIMVAETALKDPALKTDPERRSAIFEHAQSAIVYANAVASSTESHLGIPRSGPTDQVVAATGRIDRMLKSINPEDFMVKVSRGFDGSKTNSNDVSVPYVGTSAPFFGLGNNGFATVSVNATYAPTTPQAAEQQKNTYGGVLGGIPAERLKSAGWDILLGLSTAGLQSDVNSTKDICLSSR